jgi:glycosyltransferase involved in cell wall biosynthesis
VINSNGWSMRELAGDAALLVEPTDTASIERAMLAVASDPAVRQDLLARGAERVKAFDWQRCAANTLNVLEAASSACSGELLCEGPQGIGDARGLSTHARLAQKLR